ncbi:MAG: thermonuclease family protein [Pseudomonadota bacterium]
MAWRGGFLRDPGVRNSLLSLGLSIATFGLLASARIEAAPLAVWQGTVTWVVDGDTLHVKPAGAARAHSVRIAQIDAPEICQPGGEASRQVLRRLALGRQVTVAGLGHDDYGRELGRIDLAGEDIGLRMVREGQAWAYRFRSNRGSYEEAQRLAQEEKRGLFSAGKAELPRRFRKRHGSCPSTFR